jgi:7,8-dihydro-6-hydroxymethylpterin-pyrophosphokinase
LDSLNAIGVNVKLRRNLDRAEEILAQLRQLAVINAKTTYMEMAWGGRFGSPSAKEWTLAYSAGKRK